eukprot:scaffold481005_cov48-Prasinocladus_malaysianus.AAC.1
MRCTTSVRVRLFLRRSDRPFLLAVVRFLYLYGTRTPSRQMISVPGYTQLNGYEYKLPYKREKYAALLAGVMISVTILD